MTSMRKSNALFCSDGKRLAFFTLFLFFALLEVSLAQALGWRRAQPHPRRERASALNGGSAQYRGNGARSRALAWYTITTHLNTSTHKIKIKKTNSFLISG